MNKIELTTQGVVVKQHNYLIYSKICLTQLSKINESCYFWDCLTMIKATTLHIRLGIQAPKAGDKERLLENVAANFETLTKAAPRIIPIAR